MNNNVATDYDDSSFSPNWKKIAELNDNLRKTFSGGYVMTSNGIVALGPKRKWEIIKKVKEFNDFDFKNNADNFTRTVLWKYLSLIHI